jgi:hypothetical protein
VPGSGGGGGGYLDGDSPRRRSAADRSYGRESGGASGSPSEIFGGASGSVAAGAVRHWRERRGKFGGGRSGGRGEEDEKGVKWKSGYVVHSVSLLRDCIVISTILQGVVRDNSAKFGGTAGFGSGGLTGPLPTDKQGPRVRPGVQLG